MIEEQELRVETQMATPTSDGSRREQEFRKMAADFNAQHIALPEGPRGGNYVYTMFCLQTSETINFEPLSMSYIGEKIDERIDGFPDGTTFPIQPTKLLIGNTKLIAMTSAPIGVAKQELSYGFASKPIPSKAK